MRTMEQNGTFLPLLSDGPGLLCPQCAGSRQHGHHPLSPPSIQEPGALS